VRPAATVPGAVLRGFVLALLLPLAAALAAEDLFANSSWATSGRVKASLAGRSVKGGILLSVSFGGDGTFTLVDEDQLTLTGPYELTGRRGTAATGGLDGGSAAVIEDAIEQELQDEIGETFSATLVSGRGAFKLKRKGTVLATKLRLVIDAVRQSNGRTYRVRETVTTRGERE